MLRPKAYHAGFDRAGAEYKREAKRMVNEEPVLRVPIAYRMGYKDGVGATAGVLQLEANMNLTKTIPAPVVPELNLLYTDEECALLPPEEFPESDEEIKDVSDGDAEGGSGGKAAAENVGDEAVNANPNVEVDAEVENVDQD